MSGLGNYNLKQKTFGTRPVTQAAAVEEEEDEELELEFRNGFLELGGVRFGV